MNDVQQIGDVISHDNVIFGVDLNSSMNYVVKRFQFYRNLLLFFEFRYYPY